MKLRRNDRGPAWDKDRVVYHATIARRAIVESGFKTREQLGGELHATGGGTAHAVSFTLDRRVAQAIVLGLRALRRGARGELGLGDLIIQFRAIAPTSLDAVLAEEQLTPESVVRYDSGKHPAAWNQWGGERVSKAQFDELLEQPGVEREFAGLAWVPNELLARTLPDAAYSILYRTYFYSFFKHVLTYGQFNKELYDPFFMSTRLDVLADLNEDDIGIVQARVAADWVCIKPDVAPSVVGWNEAERLAGSRGYDWSEACERHLDDQARGERRTFHSYKPVREWEDPDFHDTIAYLSDSMAEIRVWDVGLIRDVRTFEDMDDVLNASRDAWDGKGKIVDEPVAMPHFKPMKGRSL